MSNDITFAAIDLGSNSFHMIIAREIDGQLQLLDRHKESVRLRLGLNEDGLLAPDAQERALACLTRFSQRLRGIPYENIRAVGTNTLRLAGNTSNFLALAEAALGAQIDIIPGHEEARLIYSGVSHFLPKDKQQYLVMDIGGGSSEFILGQRFKPKLTISTEMGCVSISQRFNLMNKVSHRDFHDAITSCKLTLRPHVPKLRRLGWEKAIGSSGTIKAIYHILTANQWSDDGITMSGMQKLREHIIAAEQLSQVKLEGLSESRREVITGGLAILMAAFELLGIERMQASPGALREGLVLDMLGRANKTFDVRANSVRALLASSRIDEVQAERVAQTAVELYEQVKKKWQLKHNIIPLKKMLHWAALTHEVGYFISSRKYRQHSAYIIANADLPGFNQEEQLLLSWLLLHHRSKITHKDLQNLPSEFTHQFSQLLILLRLATRIHRGREDQAIQVRLKPVDEQHLVLQFPIDWLTLNPLTQLDLEIEAKRLEGLGYTLSLEEANLAQSS